MTKEQQIELEMLEETVARYWTANEWDYSYLLNDHVSKRGSVWRGYMRLLFDSCAGEIQCRT